MHISGFQILRTGAEQVTSKSAGELEPPPSFKPGPESLILSGIGKGPKNLRFKHIIPGETYFPPSPATQVLEHLNFYSFSNSSCKKI